MPNPGSFQGIRFEFMLGEKHAYHLGVEGGYAAEAVSVIQRRYFKRFPAALGESYEPTSEALAAVDDNAPEPEIPEPDKDKLNPEQYKAAVAALKERQEYVGFKKAQIRRWLRYQYMKDNDAKPDKAPASAPTPYSVFISQLSGKEIPKPRLKTAVNLWRKGQRSVIEAEAKATSVELGLRNSDQAALRDRIARALFSEIPAEERELWSNRAQAEHEQALVKWKQDVSLAVSTSPEDRQKAIQGLVHFVQPVLDAICDATGWKASLFAGGPEPAQNGKLSVISVHSGTTSGDVKMTFGRSERQHIKQCLIPMLGTFLQKCYTPEECRARTLPSDSLLGPASHHYPENDYSIQFHTIVGSSPALGSVASPSSVPTHSVQTESVVPANQIPSQNEVAPEVPTVASDSPHVEAIPHQPLSVGVDGDASRHTIVDDGTPEPTVNPFPFSICDEGEDSAMSPQRATSVPVSPAPSRPASPTPLPAVISRRPSTHAITNYVPASSDVGSTLVGAEAQSQVWNIIMNGITSDVQLPIAATEVTQPTATLATARRSSRLAGVKNKPPPKKGANKKKGKRAREVLADVSALHTNPTDDGPPAKRTRSARSAARQV